MKRKKTTDLRSLSRVSKKTRKKRACRVDRALEDFPYVNWLDAKFFAPSTAETGEQKDPTTWRQFVSRISPDILRSLPINKQELNDCTIRSAVTAWEVQHRQPFPVQTSELPAYKHCKKEGAHLMEQVERVWGRGKIPDMPKLFNRFKGQRMTAAKLLEALQHGPINVGVQELGYPFANRAVNDEYGRAEAFIPPRFDPYCNPYEPTRRSGADGHAICIIGCFHSRDRFKDTVFGGWPQRRPSDFFGNVFVTKCTAMPAGWNGSEFVVKLNHKEFFRSEEVCYALLPADLLTTSISKDCCIVPGRSIDECYSVPPKFEGPQIKEEKETTAAKKLH